MAIKNMSLTNGEACSTYKSTHLPMEVEGVRGPPEKAVAVFLSFSMSFLVSALPEIRDGQRHCQPADMKNTGQLFDIVYVRHVFLEPLARHE
jgi:hypothetical protein